ncbi:MAG: DUF799 family lipoprotein [Candidatus Cloacimonetes bacterium]|nr:DUF799 family lipoprotein [Candidatus Cloacimonadota bacterium]MBL7148964.1 DUF799 family lipoprotein [Candidatus Cloacimonadota bacterium]
MFNLNCKKLFIIATLCTILFLLSCAGSKYLYKDPSFKEPIPVAVLPFENQTTDIGAAELARLFFVIGMAEKGYTVLEYSKTDSILMSLGLTDGGQLPSISPEELHKELGVQGLLYGTLIDAQYSTYGISKKRKATIKIKLLQNGTRVWENQVSKSESGLGNILNPLAGLVEQVVDKAFEKAFAKYHGHPLEPVIEKAVYKLQDKMPGKRKVTSGWNK